MRATGVVVSVQTKEDGNTRIELLGSTWVILTADTSTVIKSLDGKTLTAADLKVGTEIDAGFGPAMAMSYPGHAHAVNINVHADRLGVSQSYVNVSNFLISGLLLLSVVLRI
ncbi:hypothetical protein [Paenibacillus ferrarius]|uniref:hypothetical protein n=1 Tax=Paenibacillus ferrarius TaxID=1469647 RepID=UPI003D2AA107